MTALLSSLFQIALLRKDPGILPASTAWVVVFTAAYAAVNVAMARIDASDRILQRTAFDVVLTFAFFFLMLAITRRAHRFPQVVNAVFGTYVVLAPLMIGLMLLHGLAKTHYGVYVLVTAGTTIVVLWYLLAVGHVLRAALDTGLVTGFAISVTWAIVSVALARAWFGTAA
jgi:hypothetical protein